MPLLEDDNIADEEKLELLQALWNIICEFSALGFNVHPIQQAQTACGKPHKAHSGADLSVPSALYLDHQVISENLAEVVEGVSVTTGKGVEV